MDDLVTWLRATMDAVESDARSFLELQPDLPDWPLLALAEVAAKRRILDEHDPDWPRLECPTCCGYDGNDNYGVERRPREAYPCRVVRWLALPEADQPGYRDEWRP